MAAAKAMEVNKVFRRFITVLCKIRVSRRTNRGGFVFLLRQDFLGIWICACIFVWSIFCARYYELTRESSQGACKRV